MILLKDIYLFYFGWRISTTKSRKFIKESAMNTKQALKTL
jgi:hypothetical protein